MFTRTQPHAWRYRVYLTELFHSLYLCSCYGLGCLRLQPCVHFFLVCLAIIVTRVTPDIRYTSFEQLRAKLLTAAEEGGRYEVAWLIPNEVSQLCGWCDRNSFGYVSLFFTKLIRKDFDRKRDNHLNTVDICMSEVNVKHIGLGFRGGGGESNLTSYTLSTLTHAHSYTNTHALLYVQT